MYFSHAFITALSLSAVSAVPVKHASRSHDVSNFNKLAIRGAPADILRANMPLGRAPAPEMVAAAQQIQALAARQSSGTASISSVMQVLSCLLDVLLGRGTSCLDQFTNSTGNSTNSTNATAAARKQLVGMLTDLSGFINSTSTDLQKSDKKHSAKKNATRDLLVRDSTSINEVLAMLNNLGQMVQKLMSDLTALGLRQQQDAEDGIDDDDQDAEPTSSTDFPVTPTEGADGKETSTNTNTSEPEKTSAPTTDDANSKEASTSTKAAEAEKTTSASTDDAKTLVPTTSKSAANAEKTGYGVNCPNPTPNDGMYRPGCPGYGRRDIRPSRRHVRRDASQDQLKQVLPALATIIEAMPGLLSAAGSNATASNTTSVEGKNGTSAAASNATNLADSGAYKKVVKQLQTAIGELNGNATSTANSTQVGDNQVPSSNASSTDKGDSKSSAAAAAAAQSKSEKENTSSRQAVSAANISHGSRDLTSLLEADGFRYVRRSTGNSDASQANQGGINVGLLNNLLNGVLSSRDTGASNASQANQGGINVDVLNSLLNGLLSSRDTGDSVASQANKGGINVDLLNNLLNGVLSSRDLQERGSQKLDMQAVNELFAQVLGGKGRGKAN
ncbi:unnamed protein product [Sympodiomycopsis kandeliae]